MPKVPKRMKFEQAMARLDEIVEAMASGEIGLEDSVASYEEAAELLAHCRQVLSGVEQRIAQIQIDGDDARTAPLDADEVDEPPSTAGDDD